MSDAGIVEDHSPEKVPSEESAAKDMPLDHQDEKVALPEPVAPPEVKTEAEGNGELHTKSGSHHSSSSSSSSDSEAETPSSPAKESPASPDVSHSNGHEEPVSFVVLDPAEDPELNSEAQAEEVVVQLKGNDEDMVQSEVVMQDTAPSVDSGPPSSFSIISMDSEDPAPASPGVESGDGPSAPSELSDENKADIAAEIVAVEATLKQQLPEEDLHENPAEQPEASTVILEEIPSAPVEQPLSAAQPEEITETLATSTDQEQSEPALAETSSHPEVVQETEPDTSATPEAAVSSPPLLTAIEDPLTKAATLDHELSAPTIAEPTAVPEGKAEVSENGDLHTKSASNGEPASHLYSATPESKIAVEPAQVYQQAPEDTGQVYHRADQESDSEDERPKPRSGKKSSSKAAGCMCC